jgi:hypothetical protein
MSVESAYDRLRKRIVEHVIGDFRSAFDAVAFGNRIHRLVERKTGPVKFRQSIGSPDTKVAITPAYDGPTVLKTCFLELDHDKALYIIEVIGAELRGNPHLRAYKGETRGKPQPQKAEPLLIPRSTTLNL